MQFKLALVALVAAELGTVAAAPHKFEKRVVQIDRVAAGPRTRNALVSMRFAFKKFGVTMPDGLAEADASQWTGGRFNSKCGEPKVGKKPQPAAKPNTAQPVVGQPNAGENGNSQAAQAPPAPPAPPAPQSAGNTGNVSTQSVDDDLEYVSPVTIGGQTLMMDFDTGSSDLWVFSTELPQQMRPTPHTPFDAKLSKSFKPMPGASFQVKYGDGSSTSGATVGTDDVQIGGVTAHGQTVELANNVAAQFVKDTKSNGLVGLAFSSVNNVKPQGAKTFFDTVKDQLAQPVMAADLRRGQPGSYTFGKVDNTKFTGELKTVPIDNSKGFWMFESGQFQVGNGPVQSNPAPKPAIADTGTTLMLIDDNVALAYYKQVPNAKQDPQTGMFVFPCTEKIPDFHVAAGKEMLTIPGQIIKFQTLDQQLHGGHQKLRKARDIILELPVENNNNNAAAAPAPAPAPAANANAPVNPVDTAQPGQMCVGGIQGNKGSQIQIFGDIFFKAQYTVFNLRDNTLSFAPHV